MLVLTIIFFFVEIVVGYITNSMALIADSFHMFSDAIALVIAFISVRMSPKKWSKNTFGWARAEILGALINAVFLCALCFSILIESVKRFMKPDLIHDPELILIIGGLGLFINLIGLVMFKDGGHHHHHHGHAHGHGHSHHHIPLKQDYIICQDSCETSESDAQKVKYGLLCKKGGHTSSQEIFCNTHDHSHSSSPDNTNDERNIECKVNNSQNSQLVAQIKSDLHSSSASIDKGDEQHLSSTSDIRLTFRNGTKQDYGSSTHHHHADHESKADENATKLPHPSSSQMNMRGVFLHVMADALGSVIVMISAIVVLYTDWWVRLYIDPILSVLMVCLILRSTWPLLTESAMILLQTVPTHIEIDSLRKRLTQEIQGVLAVHEFHVWQLAGDRIIASAHIRCHNLQDYMRIAEKVKEFFHNEGIHSTTIQPEFIDFENGAFDESNDNCALDCPSTQRTHCAPQTCCQRTNATEPSILTSGDEPILTRRTVTNKSEAAGPNEETCISINSPSTCDDNNQVI